eukprot:TRINITY_DN36414_c0_g1_i2.p1 TRINITY_DN36414_c0_g1~~TRINITY_DN36414_c0_g1_i2.p1  ORF type:complete len:144 (+),score=38.63 TRINITY_DN36414_c0_g1_i2:3-434(+)
MGFSLECFFTRDVACVGSKGGWRGLVRATSVRGGVWVIICVLLFFFFFFSSRRRHTRCREVSWARRCVQETATMLANENPDNFFDTNEKCYTSDPFCGITPGFKRPWEHVKDPRKVLTKFDPQLEDLAYQRYGKLMKLSLIHI